MFIGSWVNEPIFTFCILPDVETEFFFLVAIMLFMKVVRLIISLYLTVMFMCGILAFLFRFIW